MVPQVGYDLPHAGDGPLLDLLIEVSSSEPRQRALVQGQGVGGEVVGRGLAWGRRGGVGGEVVGRGLA